MAIVPLHQGFPFVVEPVSVDRVQMWAFYAGQTLTQEGFQLVVQSFNAFWWEGSAYRSYRSAFELVGSVYHLSSLVHYLDMLVYELKGVMEHWAKVVQLMNGHQELRLQSDQWYEDAMQHGQTAMDLRQMAVSQVVNWCNQYQLPLPEYTQAFFTDVQMRGF